jgi:hypothetical protein
LPTSQQNKKRMNRQEVINLMKSSMSEAEWNANCDKVKKACGGYPDFGYEAVVLSGLANTTAANYSRSVDIVALPSSITPVDSIHYRIAWKSTITEKTGHGDWFPIVEKRLLNERLNEVKDKYPELKHWMEFE